MSKNTTYTLTVGVVIIAVIGVLMFFNRNTNSNNTNAVSSTGRYCGSDGEFVDTMPIQSHRSYCLKTDASSFTPNQPTDVKFQIVDDQGTTLKDFDVIHEKIMHVIVVRKDLTNFQHIHPEFDQSTGMFMLSNVNVATDGPYRLFADFTPTSSQMGTDGMKLPVVDYVDVNAGSIVKYQPVDLGEANSSDTVGLYDVSLAVSPAAPEAGQDTTLTFTVTENGKKVTDLEKYLGELGHTVVLKNGDLNFLHTHPMDQKIDEQDGTITFGVPFAEPGRFKAFMQFQHRGQVVTTAFVLPAVGENSATTSEDTPEEVPDMMGH